MAQPRSAKSTLSMASPRTLAWMVVPLVLGGIAAWSWFGRTAVTLPAGVTASDYERVARSLQRSGRRTPDGVEVLFKLGVEHAAQEKWAIAATLFSSVPQQDPRHGREARYLQAQSVLQQNRLRDSERLFREYLADIPEPDQPAWPTPAGDDDRLQAIHYLSYLLAVELRFDERRKLLGELIAAGDADLFDTLACHFQSLMEWNNTHAVERLEKACLVSPDDWQLQAVLAQYRIAQGQPNAAWQLLQKCREQVPHDLAIAAACLTCLEERGDADGYLQLGAQLPPRSEVDPGSLLRHRGQIALRQKDAAESVASFQQALTLDPAQVACRLGLAEALLMMEQPERRTRELAVAKDLARIQNRLGWATSQTPTPEVLLEIARLSADAGLRTAAADVCRISIQQFPKPGRFEELLRTIATDDSAEGGAP